MLYNNNSKYVINIYYIYGKMASGVVFFLLKSSTKMFLKDS